MDTEGLENRFINDKILLDKAAGYRDNASELGKEAFKIEILHSMMNTCADQCKLPYYESGLKKASDDVLCFKNCVTKSYKLASSSLE